MKNYMVEFYAGNYKMSSVVEAQNVREAAVEVFRNSIMDDGTMNNSIEILSVQVIEDELMVELIDDLEAYGYGMRMEDLKSSVDYIREKDDMNEYTVAQYVQDLIDNESEMLIRQ